MNAAIPPSTPHTGERVLQGLGVSSGIAIGFAEFVGQVLEEPELSSISKERVESEYARLAVALEMTKGQILELHKLLGDDDGGAAPSHSTIFESHALLLEDPVVIDEVRRKTADELKCIDWVYYQTIRGYIDQLRKVDDAYLSERAVDLEDVAARLLKNLRAGDGASADATPVQRAWVGQTVLLGHDLSPSDTAGIDRSQVRGFATEVGSATSHTAILARSLNLPAVVALHELPRDSYTGAPVIIDGYEGRVILNPTQSTLRSYAKRAAVEEKRLEKLSDLKTADTRTKDGDRMLLSANLEFVTEIADLKELNVDGVGLFRTEFLFLCDGDSRSEECQYETYRTIAEGAGRHGVIIRTLDIGGDKLLPELRLDPEPNPFLGWRGIRLTLDEDELFRSQLRAILRASAHGKVRVMFPFISTLEELQAAKRCFNRVKKELADEGVPFDPEVEIGAMIEIPSAVFIAGHLAKEVDFFSIGTNDLIQYTTAVDRVNDRVAHLYQPMHPAVIEMIRTTVEAAHRNGIWCGICGEAAADLEMTPIWVGLGVDELSVGLGQLLKLRAALASLSGEPCRQLVRDLRENAGKAEDVRQLCLQVAQEAYPDLLISKAVERN